MKPTLRELKTACPDVSETIISEHLKRLGDRYFDSFSKRDLCRHLTGLSHLTTQRPVEVLTEVRRDGSLDCTVLAFDYASEFSIITGLLAGMGFSIISGDVFTYDPVAEKPSNRSTQRLSTGAGHPKRRARGRAPEDLLNRRRIVDHFTGIVDASLPLQTWVTQLKENMVSIIGLLEKGEPQSTEEAKRRVNQMVVKRLTHLSVGSPSVLYPVRMEVESEEGAHTRLRVVSQDTPAFLYALSNALSLQNITIEHVIIRTIHGRIEDEIELAGTGGKRLADPDILNRIKLSVLLSKQFTYFLDKAPDPFTALSRFEHLVSDILQLPDRGQWLGLLTNPRTLQDLARVLGASDFLWEDFIRLQYETLLPMFQPHTERTLFSKPLETVSERLGEIMGEAGSLEEKKKRLNEFKDQEIFLIDLDYIIHPKLGFQWLAERLTHLGENVIRTASRLVYEHLVTRFGQPRTVGGIRTQYAILALGKLGGVALGYASDIELLFVYSDNGETDGKDSIGNAEFFDRLVKEVNQFISAKRQGIFHLDLRLRPYGHSGPLACSLETFCRYYGQGGQAHSYERLALTRLRHIGGDIDLGTRLERLRDEMVYFSRPITLRDLQDLREKQFQEKTKGGRLNAKFSPGGLVDLEYGVQILQVINGKHIPSLRSPRILEALEALSDAGVLSSYETEQLIGTYGFLRHLINGLRMLRGSAEDVFLPAVDSDEFEHLARRLGYTTYGPLEPAQQLHFEFETHLAAVRVFWEKHFGRDSLPDSGAGTVADLALSDQMPREVSLRILSNVGFKDPSRANINLQSLAGRGILKDTFAKIVLLAFDILKRNPDPDRALNNWERFIHSMGSPEFHYNLLLSQPMRLDILLNIFSGSQFLADTLIRNPGFFEWVIIPEILHNMRKKKDIEEELRTAGSGEHREWLNKLRRMRRREILRIGTRDLYLGIPTCEIITELSVLVDAFIQVVLEKAMEWIGSEGAPDIPLSENRFCVMAMGKLGGNELNYSSDIDLIGLWDDSGSFGNSDQDHFAFKAYYGRVMAQVRADLSEHTDEGYAYRVDLRLRPFGSAGELVSSASGLLEYYRHSASPWEIQAALKMRPVAGNLQAGDDFVREMRPILLQHWNRDGIVRNIKEMRDKAVQASPRGLHVTIDVKNGSGGIRDIEFLVQGLQLIHGPDKPELIQGNTLTALDLLSEAHILPQDVAEQLKEDYIFLRRTEHYLQLLEDLQIHSLPKDPDELTALAKRMMGMDVTAGQFVRELQRRMERIRGTYTSFLTSP
jgi:glutamate-ammonia-ligase adenylyltransferase